VIEELERGSRLSRAVCLRYVLRHPVAFREYWTPKVSRRRFWHRYTFSPIVLAKDQGDTALYCGRAVGKSFAAFEPEIVRKALARPGEETLVTSFRRVHTSDRMERAIDYFELIPFLKLYQRRILRSPVFHIELHNDHNIYGIAVGDDNEARTAQGKHASTILFEETQQYPLRAFLKLDGAKDPRGCTTIMVGVPDGRLDTPFRKADENYTGFEGRRIHLSRRQDPYFDRKTLRTSAEVFGGEDSDLFKQEVDAEWGHPAWSAWDLETIYRCFEPKLLPRVVVEVSGKQYRERGLTPEVVCAELPGRVYRHARVRIAMDVGYSEPSAILVLEEWQERHWLSARVMLVNRMEHDDQAAILSAIGALYEADEIGIDTSEGEGRAIAATLDLDPRWGPHAGRPSRIVRYVAHEHRVVEYDDAGDEVKEPARDIGTRTLRSLFSHRDLALPNDEDIPSEFNQEKETRTADGKRRIITPKDVHVSDSFRVFALMHFLAHPPQPPSAQAESAFVLPEWGESAIPWRASV
jgi:hypothetical protein